MYRTVRQISGYVSSGSYHYSPKCPVFFTSPSKNWIFSTIISTNMQNGLFSAELSSAVIWWQTLFLSKLPHIKNVHLPLIVAFEWKTFLPLWWEMRGLPGFLLQSEDFRLTAVPVSVVGVNLCLHGYLLLCLNPVIQWQLTKILPCF